MLNVVNTNFNKKQNADSVKAMNSFYERAYSLIGDQNAKDAFDQNAQVWAGRVLNDDICLC